MELATAARHLLLASPTVGGYTITGEQKRVYKYRLDEKVDGTGLSALVVRPNGGWSARNPRQSAEYPVLDLLAYSDVSRDTAGQILRADAEDRAWALWRAADAVLHGSRGQEWGRRGDRPGLQVVDCRTWNEPFVVDGANDRNEGEPLGDSVYVLAKYGLITYH